MPGQPSIPKKYSTIRGHPIHSYWRASVSRFAPLRELESWLGITIQENVALSAAVGGTAKRSRLSWYERLIITREASAGMRALGYSEDEKERQV